MHAGKMLAEQTRRQREYSDRIEVWLGANFPELCGPESGAHPAAIVTVYRLHAIHGRGTLTRAEHGDLIRGSVRAWEAKWGSTEEAV